MSRKKLLVASRSRTVVDAVVARLRNHPEFQPRPRVLVNGHANPLHDVQPRPDLLLLHHSPGSPELGYLAELDAKQRLPLVVFGPDDDSGAMRLAMRAGATDYLPEPLDESDLVRSLEQVNAGLPGKASGSGKLISVVSAKGGAGGSFVACNLGCELAAHEQSRVVALDLDLDFGTLARYLDLSPDRGVLEALGAILDLDEVSAGGFTTAHRSGLELMAAPAARPARDQHVSAEHLDGLCQILIQHYDHVVCDVPRRTQGFGVGVIERSDHVLLVLQQSLAQIDCANRMLQMMYRECALSPESVTVVVNRFVKNSMIEIDDVKSALRLDDVHIVPNHYGLVSESLDTGQPVVDKAKGSNVSKALRNLAKKVGGIEMNDERGLTLLGRTLPNFLGAS